MSLTMQEKNHRYHQMRFCPSNASHSIVIVAYYRSNPGIEIERDMQIEFISLSLTLLCPLSSSSII